MSQYAVAQGGMAVKPAAAREGAGMPLTQPGCPLSTFPFLLGCTCTWAACTSSLLPRPSASEMAPACLKI